MCDGPAYHRSMKDVELQDTPRLAPVATDLGLTISAAIGIYFAAFAASQKCTTKYSCGSVCSQCSRIEPAVAAGLIVLFLQAVILVLVARRLNRAIWAFELIGACVLVFVMYDY